MKVQFSRHLRLKKGDIFRIRVMGKREDQAHTPTSCMPCIVRGNRQ